MNIDVLYGIFLIAQLPIVLISVTLYFYLKEKEKAEDKSEEQKDPIA